MHGTRFEREIEVNDCTVTQKYLKNTEKYHVSVVGFDPLTQKNERVWDFVGEDKEDTWEKAKNYAKRYHY